MVWQLLLLNPVRSVNVIVAESVDERSDTNSENSSNSQEMTVISTSSVIKETPIASESL